MNRPIHHILTALAASALLTTALTSCAGDDEATAKPGSHQFSTVPIQLTTSQTPATTSEDISRSSNNNLSTMQADANGFSLYAFFNDGYNYINGQNFKYTESSDQWGNKSYSWTSNDIYYWPNPPKLDFYALYPATAPSSNVSYENMSTKKTVHVELKDEYEDDKGTVSNYDILYASKVGYDASTTANNGVYQDVPLQFKHMLSQILFQLKVNVNNCSATIAYVKAHDLLQYGDFNLETETWSLQNWNEMTEETDWLVKRYSKGSYQAIENSWTTININEDRPFFVLPNTLPAWDPAADGNPVEKGKRFHGFVEVKCNIKRAEGWVNNVYYNAGYVWPTDATSDSDMKSLYIPFGGTWVAGKRHIVTLDLANAYDSRNNNAKKVFGD